MARGWNLSTSVVRMYRCGYNNYYSTCISSFLAAASLFICSFKKCFFVLVNVIFVKYIANVSQRIFEIVQISKSANNIIINCIDN